MSVIDNTNPKHVLSWEHRLDGRITAFTCSCGEWAHDRPTPPTLRDAEFAQRVAIEQFNDHLDSLTPADPDAPVDAVIINETPRALNFSKTNDLTFVSKTDHRGKVIYENNADSVESFWRDPNTSERVDSGHAKYAPFDEAFLKQAMGSSFMGGGYTMYEASSRPNINEKFGKFGGIQSTVTVNNNEPADALTVEKLNKVMRDFQTRYPDMRKRR